MTSSQPPAPNRDPERTDPTSPARRQRSSANAVLVGILALGGLAVLPRVVPRSLTPESEMVGKPAPDVTLPVIANGEPGARMALAALKGRPVLLDFWSSSCGPCGMVAPLIDRVARRHGKEGLVVLGVNVDDTPEVVRTYARKKGLSYPMVLDVDGQATRRYGVNKLPSMVVIDRQGNVRGFYTGLMDESSLDEVVSAAM